MPLSYNILKDLKCNGKTAVLEIRHNFNENNCYNGDIPDESKLNMRSRDIIAEAEQKALRILEYAKSEAEFLRSKLRKEALNEAETIKNTAYQEAYEKGTREAIEEARNEAELIREQARMVLKQAEEIRKQTLESLEQEIINLAVEIAEKVLNAKLELDPQIVVDLASESIKMLKERDKVILLVNPDEVGLYEDRRYELEKELSPKGELHIIADHEIEPGGCVVETEYGYIDAQLKTRWKALLDNLEFKS